MREEAFFTIIDDVIVGANSELHMRSEITVFYHIRCLQEVPKNISKAGIDDMSVIVLDTDADDLKKTSHLFGAASTFKSLCLVL